MRNYIFLATLTALLLGSAGGVATTYLWLDRYAGADPHQGESARPHDDEHNSAQGPSAHAEKGGHDEHGESRVRLSAEAMQEFGVEVAVAAGGKLERTLKVPGEIVLNADRVAHIVPRVTGMVREVRKNVGDKVETGEVMAVLESRELAEAKAADLTAEARLKLAESNFKRVDELLKKNIAPEKEYYGARQQLDEAEILHRETMAKLHALGLDHDQVNLVSSENAADFSRYEIKAPFPATVVEKHAALGEVHDSNSDVFLLADLSTVWVDITLYSQDAARVQAGSRVRLSAPGPDGQAAKTEGAVFYVSPIIRESTRTGLARAVIANDRHVWKPGLFVTAEIVIGQDEVAVLAPNDAVQLMENQPVVFVAEKDEFEKRTVVVGRSNENHSEIASGLKPGERYVATGAFILKAELGKGAGGHEH